ncbi:antibiotic biosynthesis monooxygenase [Paenibacillus glycanilyticus]|uniref:antibiotic biosynthesis monooxygenase family protein n=1 Tax=Paenibacillus glycanilyticus TaxID=126569 RepID=UPI0020425C5A|nr:antibiotic biosynthesis monooxygenase family protein [Paenibacillus glycanilyticus]MCM3631210.1 antibiotic biosynthesis monooxygenase [Paenibacillus glycanilyticus]
MTKINANESILTFINVFKVEPENQQRVVELLTEATDSSVKYAPGFISCALHKSTDGTKVTMYAQWKDFDHYQAMRDDPRPLPFFKEALTIATFDSGMYEVVKTFEYTEA